MNDPAALAISLLAFVVSGVSTFISIRLQMRSGRESALNQLGEITQKIIDSIAESNQLGATDPARRDVTFFSKTNAINYKLSLLARQADYLIELESPIVSDVQYSLIATGLAQIGDLDKAQRYWELAVDKSPGEFYKIVNLRGFASFLFAQGRYEAGGERYQEALKIWSSDTDFHKYHNAYTYQMWFVSGMQNLGPNSETNTHFERARQLFDSISNQGVRSSSLYGLEVARNAMMMGVATPPTSSPITGTGTMPRVSVDQPPKPQ